MTRRRAIRLGGIAAAAAVAGKALPERTTELLNEVQRRACLYFYEEADPVTGLVLDRARLSGSDSRRVSSIAATGFGLSALALASRNGYLSTKVAEARVERTLEFFANRLFHQKGFFFHFLDVQTGQRAFNCEVSSVDTTWFLLGAIHARQHFDSRRIRKLTSELLQRVDWRWMWAGGPTLCHGWTPEKGFLPYRWDQYSELLAMYILAIGSTTYPIPGSSWDAVDRPTKVLETDGMFIESPAPLFVHQYSHAWLDFRGQQDGYTNYFDNSRLATKRHRDFCLSLRERFPWIDENMWGITASDSRYGYIDWGGPGTKANSRIDGTLVPCAAGGSLVFLPEECGRVLTAMLERYGSKVWTKYGFVDAFHPQAGWWAPDVIGIDLGIMLLMAENQRTQSVWKSMMDADEVKRGLRMTSFTEG